MKKFITGVIHIFLAIIVINIIIILLSNQIYYSLYTEKPSKVFNSFILADSRGAALKQIPENYGVYNFSFGSDSYNDILIKLKYLIYNEYSIERIYLIADSHTLSPYRELKNNQERSILFLSIEEYGILQYVKKKYGTYIFPLTNRNVIKILYNKIKSIIITKPINANILWQDRSEKDRINQSAKRIKGQFPSDEKSEILTVALKEIINLCNNNDIELIGVKFPLSREYLRILGDRDYGASKILLQNSILIMDMTNIFDYNPEYFGNQDHINAKGADVFSKEVFN